MNDVIILPELNPITHLPFTDTEKTDSNIFKRRINDIQTRMTELGIDIEIKSFKSPLSTNLVYGFYSICFEGKQSCTKIIDGHNYHYDKSEMIDVVCDYFQTISTWRENQKLYTNPPLTKVL